MNRDADREQGRAQVRRAVLAEMAARRWNVSDLAREAGIDHGTASDFVGGSRWPQLKTQGQIEDSLGWEPGTIAAILDGATPPPVGGNGEDDDPDVIRYRRPDGLSDDAWAAMRDSLKDYIEYQLDKAARER